MKTFLKIAGLLLALLLLLLAGSTRMARFWHLSGYDRDIGNATKAIEKARDNARRAEAYARRGSAYSEKARYSRAFKLISTDEYDRLFGQAIKDHDQAIALDPSAEAYYSRGATYYDRANLNAVVDGKLMGSDAERKAWFDPAASDFRKAIEKDSHLYMAWDKLGLIHETTGELDQAISDYSQEMALNPLGKSRLADAYCARGSVRGRGSDASIADFEKSIELGATADGCSCDPYNPLVVLYAQSGRYDQGWALVARARQSKKWLDPEVVNLLKKKSGRSN